MCVRDGFGVIDMDTDDKVINLDTNFEDPQLCAIIASDIFLTMGFWLAFYMKKLFTGRALVLDALSCSCISSTGLSVLCVSVFWFPAPSHRVQCLFLRIAELMSTFHPYSEEVSR
ncbi:unnamed protein product [Linum trigynum]|uniref:Uncharacterized protein n=1 Tax=Linum trigynum TaxID=586398 RepID=A0AAV2C6V4_9ROSI